MKTRIFLMVLVITALFTGCLGGTRTAGEVQYLEQTKAAATSEHPVMREEAAKGGFLGTLHEEVPAPAPSEYEDEIPMERKIIKRAYLHIEVEDFETAASEVERLARASGGFVSDSSSHVTDTGHRRGSITIRVPQEGFLDVVEEIKKLGTVESTSISGEDVTEEYIDLDARLRNLQRQEERLLEILDNATTVEDILKVEEHLGRVRGEIERIQGRLRYLDNLVTLATITVELFEPEPITHSFGLREALSDSVRGFINTATALIVFAGYAMPVVLVLFVVYVIIGWPRRRRPRKAKE